MFPLLTNFLNQGYWYFHSEYSLTILEKKKKKKVFLLSTNFALTPEGTTENWAILKMIINSLFLCHVCHFGGKKFYT